MGVKDGRGLYSWKDGNKYIGEWKNNAINGNGIYIWNDGRSYNGQWEESMMHG